MLICRDYRNQIFAFLSFCHENGVMMIPKRYILKVNIRLIIIIIIIIIDLL